MQKGLDQIGGLFGPFAYSSSFEHLKNAPYRLAVLFIEGEGGRMFLPLYRDVDVSLFVHPRSIL